MSRRRHSLLRRLRHLSEHLLFGAALWVFGLAPDSWRSPIAVGLSAVFARFLLFRRSVVERNLAQALGELSPIRRRRLLRDVVRHTILLVLEAARLARTDARRTVAAVEAPPDASQYVAQAQANGQHGFILASAHIGNWEWLGAWYALTFGRMGMVYKPMHNPWTDRALADLRRRFGAHIFSTRQSVPRDLIHHLRSGGAVAILADQDAGRSGHFIPFFGKPASTSLGMANLAVRLQIPIVAGFCLRKPSGGFRVRTFPPIWPDPQADPAAETVRLTIEYGRMVEQVIREAPEQYFWWHRRWKTQPRSD
jgi:KDO2-lipid IV(A) lauroyltransferase